MKIVHVITGLSDGGAEAVLFRLCTYDEDYHHVVVSMMDEGKYGPLLRDAGVMVYCLGLRRGRVSASGLYKLWQLFRKLRPDVVQTWMYHADLLGGIVARLAGCRTIVWGIRNSTLEPSKSSASTILLAKVCARLSRIVPARIVVCAEQAAVIHRELGYAPGKMIVIANGYDVSRFRPDLAMREALRKEWGIISGVPLIGTVARFDPQKDHVSLLKALGLLKANGAAFHCVLVGKGMDDNNDALKRIIHEVEVDENILLLGSRNDIPAVMNALDIHVLSSAYGEAFPNVLAEAMACGTPCVTTDVGDAEMIVKETGWVTPPRDHFALSDAIGSAIEAYADEMNWSLRCNSARKRIEENFDIKTMIRSYHAVWRV